MKLCTIRQGAFILIQGTYVRTLPDGRVAVRVGQKIHLGTPVSTGAQQAAYLTQEKTAP
eukprot:CAMPEP_0195331912 /NCGR_PEP_ID=MMETSP0708-20121125/12947_1 /TAXON_ID=33640 /ORGANISM="Asterionellopsis glacialis, Strain CCMP134" /LENGTH=58 /DNA_ID=CAMNT_0040400535 /DNA_START=63 /DNA_END=240 /DNA_ORIENTATION=-